MKRQRNRQWLLGAVLILLMVWAWWSYLYSPVQGRMLQAEEEVVLQLKKKMKIKEKIHELEARYAEQHSEEEGVDIFSDVKISGKSIEEMNAVVQQEVQDFLDENEIELKKYRVLRETKWLDYQMGVLEFTIQTNHHGLAVLLKFIEDFPKLVRVGRMNINYRKSRGYNLNVTFRLENLFVEKG